MYSQYSIQFFDQDTGCIVFEIYLEDMEKYNIPIYLINTLKNIKNNDIINIDANNFLDISVVKNTIDLWPDIMMRLVNLESDLPYRIHGGREYFLMMKGNKPLSVFSYINSKSELFKFIEKYFKPHVKSGNLIEKCIIEPDNPEKDVYTKLMYALPAEKWRIDAYIIMYEASKKSGWNDGFEFIEGSLLGYSSEENNLWLSFRKSHGLKWGLFSFFMIISDEEIQQIKLNGMKAFGLLQDTEVFIYGPDRNKIESLSINSIKSNKQGSLVRLFINFIKINKYYMRECIIDGVNITIFHVKRDNFPNLNEIIDGKIEIVD